MNRLAPVAALSALAALALAGCSGPTPAATSTATVTVQASATSAPTATGAPGAASAQSGSASASTSAAASAAADPGRPAGQCADGVLKVAVGTGTGAAGTAYSPLVFTNTGSTSCVLRGAPGVSIVGGGDGTQLGKPATRDQSDARDVRLAAHGGQAHATLGVVDFSAQDGSPIQDCTPKRGDGYRVYPPHSTRAFLVRDPHVLACDPGPAFMRVGVVAAGAK